MKKIFLCCLILSYFLSTPITSFALTSTPTITSSSVKATVPGKDFSVSGIVSPNASVVLLGPDGTPYQGVVADANGNFQIENVLIAQGLTEYCLEAIDVQRLGSSLACFDLEPTPKSEPIIVDGVFLPPTIGLQRQEVLEGSDALVFGYSMPSAKVDIEINKEQSFPVTASASGYYEYTMPDVKVGSYLLVAGAMYEAKPSAPSVRPALLQAISVVQASESWIEDNWWIPLVVSIIILLLTLLYVYRRKVRKLLGIRETKLHHSWFVGY